MYTPKDHVITASELKAYLYSLEKEQEREKSKKVHEYKMLCTTNGLKTKKREVIKIEKEIQKDYTLKFKLRDELLKLLDEARSIPEDVEKLEITEYMLYRVDMRKTEKIVNRVAKKLAKRYEEIQKELDEAIRKFPALDDITEINYSEFEVQGNNLEKTKEQYKLEYTEEERNALIQKELDIIEKAKRFNSVPIPHEILKNSDRDIQSKMQRFNAIRQKRIRILDTMKIDYERLIDPREIQEVIEDALKNIDTIKHILTRTEFSSVKNALHKRKKRIYRSTNEIRNVIEAKEKKTGIQNFNIQEARYLRMETLRNIILEATNDIKANPIEELEEQLEKLKISYQREKQFASVIEKLDNGTPGYAHTEVRAYEEQILNLHQRLTKSRRIVQEAGEKIKHAKKELLVLWKMEITTATTKRKEGGIMLLGSGTSSPKEPKARSRSTIKKLKKVSGGKHAMT